MHGSLLLLKGSASKANVRVSYIPICEDDKENDVELSRAISQSSAEAIACEVVVLALANDLVITLAVHCEVKI